MIPILPNGLRLRSRILCQLFGPLIEEEVFVKAESHSFLRRVFGGAMKPMLSTMVENEDLSPEDIDDLKRILEKKKGK
jgi:BlaI family penicillinase repressor